MSVSQKNHGDAAGLTAVQLWLYGIAALIAAMVVVGGATRLTDSGLSITEWQLITGTLPPLGEAQWMTAFEKYQQIPEFKVQNSTMTLAEFKVIYWWEWAHRFLGRFVGFAFAVPLAFFWLRGYLPQSLKPKLVGLLVLGGLQGALGWYMVRSGLVERVDVSQYRLAAHLGLAVALFGAVFWVAFGLRRWTPEPRDHADLLPKTGLVLVVLVFLQIIAGAFVAGLDAGHGYNTWPLMNGALIPDGLFAMSPAWINLFENALTVQFVHRTIAYVIVVVAGVYCLTLLRRLEQGALAISALLILLVVVMQVALGVATLLSGVHIGLALCHQVAALVLLALLLNQVHMVRTIGQSPAADRAIAG